jgi:ABC-type Zn uptake system ZnuABC Zn-binding protein ZnuA
MNRRSGLILGLAAGIAATWGMIGCSQAVDPWAEEEGHKRIVVTIAPLHSFVRAVAGDRVAVKCLCTTTGPHHYQIDTHDARVLKKADLLLAVGLQLDNFADVLRAQAGAVNLRYIKLGQRLPTRSLLEFKHGHSHDHSHGDHDHSHSHGKWDPHIWLGLPEVIVMVGVIRDELCELDGEYADTYRKNADAYIGRLKKLHEAGKKLLADKKVKRIITFHEALAYLARTFDLEIADVIELHPGADPSAVHLANIVKQCSDPNKPIGAITVEPQYPTTTSAAKVQAELRRKGINVQLVEIDPLETAEVAELKKERGDWYETRMHKNLKALASTLP